MTPVSPSARLWQLATGHFLPRCLHVIAELGVADCLNDTPVSAESLASAIGADADAIERMLRLLAVEGIFEARGPLWCHTELSRMLRSDHPRSMRPFVRMIGSRISWAAAGELGHAAKTGVAAVQQVAPGGMWSYFKDHPEAARIFDAAMTAKSDAEIAALIPAFDFSRYGVIADIAGGRGHILGAVLEATPGATGVLFDLPTVVANLEAVPRRTVQGGDFFNDPLPQADAYILSNVLHDWADAEAERIVRSIRRAAPPDAELLVLEAVMPEGSGPHHAKVLDIVMLTLTGGRERTRGQYEALLEAGGFRLQRIVPTAGPISVIVAARA
jgi:hypothetical protein